MADPMSPTYSLDNQIEVLSSQLDRALHALAVLYEADRAGVAQVCDEEADPSGALLGWVRNKFHALPPAKEDSP